MFYDFEYIESLRKMDEAKNKNILYEIGSKAAAAYILPEHIKSFN